MPLQSYRKFSHKMKTIRESNCLGERISSTSFCQKAPKITLQLPHRLHLNDTREHLKGEVQLAEKGSKPTSGTLPFDDCFTSSCSSYSPGKLESQTIEKGYPMYKWVYNSCDLTAIDESNETAEIGQREKLFSKRW